MQMDSEQKKIDDKIRPILEKMVYKILKEKPDNIVK